MRSKDIQNIVGGLCLIAIGVFAAFYAQRYPIGELRRMGPGFFPVSLGVLLAILGTFIALPAFFRSGDSIRFDVKGFAWVMASVMVFGFGLTRLGLIGATVAAVLVATMAADLRWRTRFVLAGVMVVITWLVFSVGLGMPIPLWPRSPGDWF
jgi:hypothetical protein